MSSEILQQAAYSHRKIMQLLWRYLADSGTPKWKVNLPKVDASDAFNISYCYCIIMIIILMIVSCSMFCPRNLPTPRCYSLRIGWVLWCAVAIGSSWCVWVELSRRAVPICSPRIQTPYFIGCCTILMTVQHKTLVFYNLSIFLDLTTPDAFFVDFICFYANI